MDNLYLVTDLHEMGGVRRNVNVTAVHPIFGEITYEISREEFDKCPLTIGDKIKFRVEIQRDG